MVLLQCFSRNIEAQIGAVNKTFYKAEIVGQKVGTFIHNQNAVCVKLKSLFIILWIKIHRRILRDEHKCVKCSRALLLCVYNKRRVVVIIELLLIKLIIFLGFDFAFILSPKRNHRVENFIVNLVDVLALFVGVGHSRCHFHHNRVANIIAVFLNKLLYSVLLKIVWVFLVFGIFLNIKSNNCAVWLLFTRLNSVAVCARRSPFISLVTAVCLWNNLNLVGNHKWRIKSDTELTDYLNIISLFIVGIFVFEIEWVGFCDCAEILFKLLGCHTDAVIRNGDGACVLIKVNADFQIILCCFNTVIGQRFEIKLVRCIARIWN